MRFLASAALLAIGTFSQMSIATVVSKSYTVGFSNSGTINYSINQSNSSTYGVVQDYSVVANVPQFNPNLGDFVSFDIAAAVAQSIDINWVVQGPEGSAPNVSLYGPLGESVYEDAETGTSSAYVLKSDNTLFNLDIQSMNEVVGTATVDGHLDWQASVMSNMGSITTNSSAIGSVKTKLSGSLIITYYYRPTDVARVANVPEPTCIAALVSSFAFASRRKSLSVNRTG